MVKLFNIIKEFYKKYKENRRFNKFLYYNKYDEKESKEFIDYINGLEEIKLEAFIYEAGPEYFYNTLCSLYFHKFNIIDNPFEMIIREITDFKAVLSKCFHLLLLERYDPNFFFTLKYGVKYESIINPQTILTASKILSLDSGLELYKIIAFINLDFKALSKNDIDKICDTLYVDARLVMYYFQFKQKLAKAN